MFRYVLTAVVILHASSGFCAPAKKDDFREPPLRSIEGLIAEATRIENEFAQLIESTSTLKERIAQSKTRGDRTAARLLDQLLSRMKVNDASGKLQTVSRELSTKPIEWSNLRSALAASRNFQSGTQKSLDLFFAGFDDPTSQLEAVKRCAKLLSTVTAMQDRAMTIGSLTDAMSTVRALRAMIESDVLLIPDHHKSLMDKTAALLTLQMVLENAYREGEEGAALTPFEARTLLETDRALTNDRESPTVRESQIKAAMALADLVKEMRMLNFTLNDAAKKKRQTYPDAASLRTQISKIVFDLTVLRDEFKVNALKQKTASNDRVREEIARQFQDLRQCVHQVAQSTSSLSAMIQIYGKSSVVDPKSLSAISRDLESFRERIETNSLQRTDQEFDRIIANFNKLLPVSNSKYPPLEKNGHCSDLARKDLIQFSNSFHQILERQIRVSADLQRHLENAVNDVLNEFPEKKQP